MCSTRKPTARDAQGIRRIVHHDPDGDEDVDARVKRIVATRGGPRPLRPVTTRRSGPGAAGASAPAAGEDGVRRRRRTDAPPVAPKVAPKAPRRATTLTSGKSIKIRIRNQCGEVSFFRAATTAKLYFFTRARRAGRDHAAALPLRLRVAATSARRHRCGTHTSSKLPEQRRVRAAACRKVWMACVGLSPHACGGATARQSWSGLVCTA